MQDVQNFKQLIQANPEIRSYLQCGSGPGLVTITRAPGRLDVLGGVGDYSGALVAEMSIAEAALAALRPRTDRRICFWSFGIESENLTPQVSMSLDEFFVDGRLADYPAVHARLCRDPKPRWAAYLAGCFYVLLAEKVIDCFRNGANIFLQSHVPLGAGVSSSAAIEVATMQAINRAYELGLDGVTLARLAQSVENRVVGAPCGIMDQMSSALCERDSLLLLLCQPHEIQGTQKLPEGVRVFGINSNIKHSVGGSSYTRARVAAFMGRRIIGVDYLANISLETYERLWRQQLPESILGSDFLNAYGETGDTVTQIDPEVLYNVRTATGHGINEHNRVMQFTDCLIAQPVNITLAGQLMYEAHASYTNIGLGSEETDLIVEFARAAGPTKGIYGAKISGGGSGGTVAILTSGDDAEAAVHEIAAAYGQKTGLTPQLFVGGASPGAIAFGDETMSL